MKLVRMLCFLNLLRGIDVPLNTEITIPAGTVMYRKNATNQSQHLPFDTAFPWVLEPGTEVEYNGNVYTLTSQLETFISQGEGTTVSPLAIESTDKSTLTVLAFGKSKFKGRLHVLPKEPIAVMINGLRGHLPETNKVISTLTGKQEVTIEITGQDTKQTFDDQTACVVKGVLFRLSVDMKLTTSKPYYLKCLNLATFDLKDKAAQTGEQITPIASDDFYQHAYQQMATLEPEIKRKLDEAEALAILEMKKKEDMKKEQEKQKALEEAAIQAKLDEDARRTPQKTDSERQRTREEFFKRQAEEKKREEERAREERVRQEAVNEKERQRISIEKKNAEDKRREEEERAMERGSTQQDQEKEKETPEEKKAKYEAKKAQWHENRRKQKEALDEPFYAFVRAAQAKELEEQKKLAGDLDKAATGDPKTSVEITPSDKDEPKHSKPDDTIHSKPDDTIHPKPDELESPGATTPIIIGETGDESSTSPKIPESDKTASAGVKDIETDDKTPLTDEKSSNFKYYLISGISGGVVLLLLLIFVLVRFLKKRTRQ